MNAFTANSYVRRTLANQSKKGGKKTGFTLVEILIVVIILGILAAIVIPQFTNASQDARRGNLKSQLQTLRSQLELYKLQHKDVPPDLITDWTQLTHKTGIDGVVDDTNGAYGPYYEFTPKNPLVDSTKSDVVKTDLTGGWKYNKTTGQVSATDVDPTTGNAIDFDETK